MARLRIGGARIVDPPRWRIGGLRVDGSTSINPRWRIGGLRVAGDTANLPPSISADLSIADPGQLVTLTVSDIDGTITSVILSGASPLPTLVGSGSTRTFKAPPVKSETVLTATATDDDGATDAVSVTVRRSGLMVCPNGTWVPAYMVTGG